MGRRVELRDRAMIAFITQHLMQRCGLMSSSMIVFGVAWHPLIGERGLALPMIAVDYGRGKGIMNFTCPALGERLEPQQLHVKIELFDALVEKG